MNALSNATANKSWTAQVCPHPKPTFSIPSPHNSWKEQRKHHWRHVSIQRHTHERQTGHTAWAKEVTRAQRDNHPRNNSKYQPTTGHSCCTSSLTATQREEVSGDHGSSFSSYQSSPKTQPSAEGVGGNPRATNYNEVFFFFFFFST